MPGTRLKRVTAIYLGVLYVAVGFTGDSLHYLATNLTGSSSHSDSGEVVVYYHVHGPDYQGHVHKFILPRHASSASTTVHRNPECARRFTVGQERFSHLEHACPILALVSTLKLGHSVCCARAIILESLITPIWESVIGRSLDVPRYSYARGPPRVFFA